MKQLKAAFWRDEPAPKASHEEKAMNMSEIIASVKKANHYIAEAYYLLDDDKDKIIVAYLMQATEQHEKILNSLSLLIAKNQKMCKDLNNLWA